MRYLMRMFLVLRSLLRTRIKIALPFVSSSHLQDSISLQLPSGRESARGAFKTAIKKSLNGGNVAPLNVPLNNCGR